jgi:glycosyltransferase involved in cell wall biosynthesis
MKVEVQIFDKGFASCHKKNEIPNGRFSVDLSEELENYPLVSCLMVTRGDSDLVRSALHCFEYQTYPNKELIIVCDEVNRELGRLCESASEAAVRVLSVEPGQTLGSLRNIAVSNAKGEILCQWDDDDLYHSDRLKICVNALIKADVAAIFLKRWLIWWPENEVLAISMERLWEGSMLIRRDSINSYPEIRKYEDTIMVEQVLKEHRVGLIDEPLLYCYTIHGSNTFDTNHFDSVIRSSSIILCYRDAVKKLSSGIPFVTHKMWKHVGDSILNERQYDISDNFLTSMSNCINDMSCKFCSRVSTLENLIHEQKSQLQKYSKDKQSLCRFVPVVLLTPLAEFLSTVSRATGSKVIEKAAIRLWHYIA